MKVKISKHPVPPPKGKVRSLPDQIAVQKDGPMADPEMSPTAYMDRPYAAKHEFNPKRKR